MGLVDQVIVEVLCCDLMGIRPKSWVSFNLEGKGMGKPEGRYGVDEYYTRVSAHMDWIKEVMGEE